MKMKTYKVKDDEEKKGDGRNAWADSSYRFAVDILLREHGYRIHRRHKSDEPLWSIDGVIYLQTQVEGQLPEQALRLAVTRQQQYYLRGEAC